ncbi:hypothetical protein ACFLV0_06830, partial [Chloroflexota bacterium]
ANWLKTGFHALKLGIIAFIIPYMFIQNPALLGRGNPLDIILAVVTAMVGVTAIAGAMTGYFIKSATWIDRGMMMAGGLLMTYPGLTTDLIGLGLLGGGLAIQYFIGGPKAQPVQQHN